MTQYPVHGGATSMRGAVLWEPNGAMTVEQLNIPRPQAEEVLIRTRGERGPFHAPKHCSAPEAASPCPSEATTHCTPEIPLTVRLRYHSLYA